MLKNITLLLLPLLFTMCNSGSSDKLKNSDIHQSFTLSEATNAQDEIVPVMRNQATPIPLNVETPREKKIIKNGNMSIDVDNIHDAKLAVDSLLKTYKAYYANEKLFNSEYNVKYNLSIRIPANHFENFISSLESGYGKITFKSIHANDVTDQFIDIETRLQNKQKYLEQYRTLLKKAKTIKDILDIEERIRVLQEEIESAKGRLKYLSNQVDFSTLDLQLSKDIAYVYTPGKKARFAERLKRSLSGGWNGFVSFILILIKLWPFWIVISLIWYIIKKNRIKRKNKNINK